MRYRHTMLELLCFVPPELLSESAARCTPCVLPTFSDFRSAGDIVMSVICFDSYWIGTSIYQKGQTTSYAMKPKICYGCDHRHASYPDSHSIRVEVRKQKSYCRCVN